GMTLFFDHARIAPGCGPGTRAPARNPTAGRTTAMSDAEQFASRRKFLQFLAASPLLAGSDLAAMAAESPNRLPDPMVWAPRNLDKLISSPREAINVFDFEPVMQKNVPPAHFGYMASGIDDEVPLRAYREGFSK